MPRTAKPVVTVDEILMLTNGKSPVRISQRPSKIIPRFLPAKPPVSAIRFSFLNRPIELNNLIPLQIIRPIQQDRALALSEFHNGQVVCRALASFQNQIDESGDALSRTVCDYKPTR